jgi:hypothetical protein
MTIEDKATSHDFCGTGIVHQNHRQLPSNKYSTTTMTNEERVKTTPVK